MHYIECPNCSADVSVTEENCPECGERIRSTPEDFIIKGKTLLEYTFDHPVAVIPDGVLYIGKDAFDCWIDEIGEPEGFCVEYVVIPEGVRKIGVGAFLNTNISEIRIPSSVVSIGKRVFSSSVEIEVAEDNPVYHVCNGCLIETASKTLIRGTDHSVIPADGSVTRIGDYAFAGCYGLTGIEIPESVTSIGECAFYECSGLTGIGIPESVTSIGECAFSGTGLTGIHIPRSVVSIGDGAFRACDLEHITVDPENPAYYADGNCLIAEKSGKVIAGCTNSVIPERSKRGYIRYIGNGAFEHCEMTHISIPAGVRSIGKWAFAQCQELESITIPGSVTSIGNYAFFGCTGMTSVTINTGVKKIGEKAFYCCSGLTEIQIPDSVTSIGKRAFEDCKGLEKIIIPESVSSIGDFAFAGCESLKTMAIPDTVTSIGDLAFSYCPELTDIYYSGTLEQWRKVKTDDSIYTTYEPYRKMTVHCADGSLEVCFGS